LSWNNVSDSDNHPECRGDGWTAEYRVREFHGQVMLARIHRSFPISAFMARAPTPAGARAIRVAERSALYSFFLKILMLPLCARQGLIPRLNDALNRCVFDCLKCGLGTSNRKTLFKSR